MYHLIIKINYAIYKIKDKNKTNNKNKKIKTNIFKSMTNIFKSMTKIFKSMTNYKIQNTNDKNQITFSNPSKLVKRQPENFSL